MIASMLTPLAKAEIEGLLARADADPEFLSLLASDPDKALGDTSLSDADKGLIAALRRVDLEERGVDVRPYRHFLVHDACLRTTGIR